MHEIDIAVRDGAASWCSCTCGWVSATASEDETIASWTTHVTESMLTRNPRV
jgi:hypothetical protein